MAQHELTIAACDEVLTVLMGDDLLAAMGRLLRRADTIGASRLEATILYATVEFVGKELGEGAVRKVRANHAAVLEATAMADWRRSVRT